MHGWAWVGYRRRVLSTLTQSVCHSLFWVGLGVCWFWVPERPVDASQTLRPAGPLTVSRTSRSAVSRDVSPSLQVFGLETDVKLLGDAFYARLGLDLSRRLKALRLTEEEHVLLTAISFYSPGAFSRCAAAGVGPRGLGPTPGSSNFPHPQTPKLCCWCQCQFFFEV